MHFSISSLFITLCVSLALIMLLSFILTHEKSYRLFRADLLFVLVSITCLRLFLPVEFPFTKTIIFPFIMNPLMDILNFEIYHQIKIMHILICIWLIGILIGISKYIQNIVEAKKIWKKIKQNSISYKTSDILNHFVYPNYNVCVTAYVPSPMILGFNKCILIPDISFTESELENIIKHEMQHLKQNDILFKQMISILVILYWWFPPIYWLQKSINFYIEIRADEKITESLDSLATLEYAETLIRVQKKTQTTHSIISSNFSTYLIGENQSILSYRVHYLLNKQIKKKTNKFLLCFLFILPILTNSIIFEAYFDNSENLKDTLSEQDLLNENYLIQHKDGTYSIYDGKTTIPIINPSNLIESGIKIVKE